MIDTSTRNDNAASDRSVDTAKAQDAAAPEVANKPKAKLVVRKPVCANETELRNNPRARSAKLRICEKIYKKFSVTIDKTACL